MNVIFIFSLIKQSGVIATETVDCECVSADITCIICLKYLKDSPAICSRESSMIGQ